MQKITRAALVLAVLVPAAAAMAGHSGGGSHGGGGSHSGGSHGSSGHGSHGGSSHGGGGHSSHGSGFHGSSGHGWHSGGHRGRGWVVYGGPFWGGWGWWGWGCPFFPDCYGPPYVVTRGDEATSQKENQREDWGMIDTEIWPDTARVYLDGRYIGAAENFDGSDDYLYLKPGDYKLEFRLEGYQSASMDLNVGPAAKIELNRKLHRKPGATVVAPRRPPEPEGGLRRYWGIEGGKLLAYAGNEDQARNRRDTDEDDDADDDPDDDSASAQPGFSIDSSPAHRSIAAGSLDLSVEPGDAVVYLDDRFIGTADEIRRADGGISVAPGTHTITATRPGFKPRTTRVEVSAGDSRTLKLTLEK